MGKPTRIDSELPYPHARPMRDDTDFHAIRRLLVDTHAVTPLTWNWEVRRWDGWRFHRETPAWDPAWEKTGHIWESEQGSIVAAAHTDGVGEVALQIDPDFRQLVEEPMLEWAETCLALRNEATGQASLSTFVFAYDTARQDLLARRGYEPTSIGGVTRLVRLGQRPLPTPELAAGYQLRTTQAGDAFDQAQVAAILNAAFQRDSHSAREIATFTSHSPSFRHDLDLVAEATDGIFAAYVGLTYDEQNRFGIVEPVCTHPDHRRLGLARALIVEGLWRLRTLGATTACVGTGDDPAANRLYEVTGFDEAYHGRIWRKLMR